ncbi:MAG: RNA polymerase sigma factor [Sedimentisphaerales bacterium]|nr:RNA polymerase sigma factor [Sedimentisphaerales bacterium]
MKKCEMSSPDNVIEIIKQCQKGEKDGFSQLVDGYSSRLFGYFYRLTGNRDDSNELLSELFLKVVEKIGTCRPETFEGWLFKMASNLFADYVRSKKRQRKMLEHMAENIQDQTQPDKDSSQLADKLTAQLQRLDAETAEIIVMRYYSGLSFEEMANIRNEPVGTCLSKVHRGLKKLRQLMENCDD